MSTQYYGAITVLEFEVSSNQFFRDIVEDIDDSFQPYGLTRCSSTWCNDNIAIIQRDSLRLLLGWLPGETEDEACVMVFSVGHTTDGGNLLVSRETCEFVRDILVDHLESYLKFDTVFHVDATQPVDTELVNTVAEILERAGSATSEEELPQMSVGQQRRTRALTRDILLDAATLKQTTPPELRQLSERSNNTMPEIVKSEIMAPEIMGSDVTAKEEEISFPQRMTIYALGATMLIYTPPVGATLLVYSTLRDMTSSPQPNQLAA